MKATHNIKRAQGFTLIELLVVITIIAILASIAVPAYNGITKRAKQMKVVSNTKQIVLALKVFGIDNDGRYPHNTKMYTKWKSDGTSSMVTVANASTAFDVLVPEYMPSEKIFYSSANPLLSPPVEDEDLATDGADSNAFDYVDKFTDSTSGAAIIVVETATSGADHPWLTDGKVVVAYNDGSSSVEQTSARTGTTWTPVTKNTTNNMLDKVSANGVQPESFDTMDILVP